MPRLAIIDIGSNTSTLAVYEGSREFGVNRVYQHGEPLRLIRQLRPDKTFPEAAIERTVELMRLFAQRALANGAEHVEAVATSAVRDARNQDELLGRIRAEGVPVKILDGEHEGVAAVVSAVNSLPIQDGFVVDMGGGSAQIAHIVTRRARQVVSLPLGALRLTDRFFTQDPPGPEAVTAFRRHVQELLAPLGWFNSTGGTLVGVGGSVRALGKVDRRERALHPGAPGGRDAVTHGHGYALTLDGIEAIWDRVSRVGADARRDIPGLGAERVDTIGAGALFFFLLLRFGGFSQVRLSAFGVREGMAMRWLAAQAGADASALVPDVRRAGLRSRFPPIDVARAEAVVQRATRLADALRVEEGRHALLAAAHVAASVARLETGVAALLDAPLPGFWHEDVMDVVDVLRSGPTRHMSAVRRDRLRVLLDIALAVDLSEVRVTDDGVSIAGGELPNPLATRFAQAWERRILAGPAVR